MSEVSNNKEDDALPISSDERDRLLAPLAGKPLALCVSGGADSMALMHLVAEWSSTLPARPPRQSFTSSLNSSRAGWPRPQQLPIPSWLDGAEFSASDDRICSVPRVVVLTIDHGLRPEAATEAKFVAAEASHLGLPHQTLKADEPPPRSGIQEWARDLRHRLILELLDAENWWLVDHGVLDRRAVSRSIIMAHHLDDQVETVLMRLARGSSLRGLGGMSDTQPLSLGAGPGRPNTIGGLVRRPFMSLPKSRLVATLNARGAKWIDDPTNSDERFERVRIRNAVEVLRTVGVGSAGIVRSANRLRAAEMSLDGFEAHWRREIIDWNGGLIGEVATPKFHGRGDFSCVRLLSVLLNAFGGSARSAELAQVERLRELLMGAEGPFKGSTLGGCRIELVGEYQDGKLLIYREGRGEGLETVPLAPSQLVEWDGGRYTVEADDAARDEVEIRALGAGGWARLKREVEGLDELKLKSAAMATMPTIWTETDLIGVPYLDSFLGASEAHKKATRAWAAWRSLESQFFRANFMGAPFYG